MSITELIEEAEDCRKLGLESNALTLLPLLVAAIKNQQRQIECALHELRGMDNYDAIDAMKEINAELKDVKP